MSRVREKNQISEIEYELKFYKIELGHLLNEKFALEDTLAKYIALYNSMPLGCIILNKIGLITDINQAGIHFLGLEKEELVNKSFSRYIAKEYQLLYSQYCKSVYQNKLPEPCQIKLLTHNPSGFVDCQCECRAVKTTFSEQEEMLIFIR